MLQRQNATHTDPTRLSRSPHISALDGLRGMAILLVLIHMLNLLEIQDGAAAYVFYRISYAGWTGVQLFFVLSGFLITGILLDSRQAKNYFSSFYVRRILRIFPLYFSVLTITFIVLPAVGVIPASVAFDQNHQVWLWTYLSNWAHLFDANSQTFPHFWSLAVEEQFYLVWPLLILTRGPAHCLKFCLGVATISLALRSLLVWYSVPGHLIYENSFCRMDALALGGAAAAALRVPVWRREIICHVKPVDRLQRPVVPGQHSRYTGLLDRNSSWCNPGLYPRCSLLHVTSAGHRWRRSPWFLIMAEDIPASSAAGTRQVQLRNVCISQALARLCRPAACNRSATGCVAISFMEHDLYHHCHGRDIWRSVSFMACTGKTFPATEALLRANPLTRGR